MGSNLSGVALLLSLVAIGVGGYALTQERSDPADVEDRMVAIEDQLARIEAALAERGTPSEREPRLLGRADEEVVGASPTRGGMSDAGAELATRLPGSSEAAAAAAAAAAQPEAGTAEEIEELVNKAVAKKAAQIQTMRNKKPSADVFAKTLALTEAQRKAAEEEVVRAQHRIKEILDIPAEDGTNFVEELVEVMAHGIAEPGKNPGRGMKFFGRILSERIPGTDETYATRIESVKQGVRDTFKRDWTDKQYATFEAWQMDPTEVQGIPGSPWKELETRIIDRAKQLGAEIPEGEGD